MVTHDVHVLPSRGGDGGRFPYNAKEPLKQGQPFAPGNVIYQVTGILPNAEGFDRVVEAVRVAGPCTSASRPLLPTDEQRPLVKHRQ